MTAAPVFKKIAVFRIAAQIGRETNDTQVAHAELVLKLD